MSSRLIKDRQPFRRMGAQAGMRYVLVRFGEAASPHSTLQEANAEKNRHGGGVYDCWADRFVTESPQDAERIRVRESSRRARRQRLLDGLHAEALRWEATRRRNTPNLVAAGIALYDASTPPGAAPTARPHPC